jgi:hypothetical protein
MGFGDAKSRRRTIGPVIRLRSADLASAADVFLPPLMQDGEQSTVDV